MNKSAKKVQRTFCTGDKWLYYKIYSGQKTADLLLTEIINTVSTRLYSKKLIDKWFFIRYADPKNHIRWRLELNNVKNIGEVIQTVFEACKPYLDAGLVYKIQTDTYKRELERYGSNSMQLAETLFWYDSVMIANMLELIEGEEGEKIRWLFSMRAIDQLLTDFEYSSQQKFDLLNILAESFGKEFNINSSLIIQLSDKYRLEKKAIFDFMNRKKDTDSPYLPLFELLDSKSKNSEGIISEIISLQQNNVLEIQLDNFLGSLIHMLMNRLFRSKQRLHEMVIYGFLFRYYRTEIAREKYNK